MNIIYDIFSALPFEWSGYRFMVNAFIGVLLICPLLGMLGTMAVNNKMAFFSDALGHSALTGIAIGVLFGIENKLFSMIAFGIILSLIIVWVKTRFSVSADTIISVCSSGSAALGIAVLSKGGGFSEYSAYLIGDILSITPKELLVLFLTLIAVTAIWAVIYNRLLLISINPELAASRGIKTRLIEGVFVILVAVVVMISIKWVGILLINSLLILPAAAARNIAKSSREHLLYTIIISLISGIGGLLFSFAFDTSAGAAIVLSGCTLYFALLIPKYIHRKD